MDTLYDILDCVVEGTDLAIFNTTTGDYVSNRPMDVEEVEDWLAENDCMFDSIEVEKDILIINVETN